MRFVEKALRVLPTVRLYHLPEKSRLIGAAGLSSARSVRQTRLYQIFPSIPQNFRFFHIPGVWERHRGGGALLPFVLRVVAGAWVDHRSGQTRMPPQERRHEEVFGLGDSFTRPGAPIRRRHAAGATRRGLMRFLVLWGAVVVCSEGVAGAGMRSGASRDAFPSGAWERHRFNGGAVAVCFEGDCRSMCWPVDRPATHAAAGAAARGVRGGLGDSFAFGLGAVAGACVDHRSGQTRMPPQERRHEGLGGLGDSFTRYGAPIRRRHAAGATRPRPAAGQARMKALGFSHTLNRKCITSPSRTM